MTYASLSYERIDRIGWMTFRTPERLNAISARRLDEMEAVLTEVESDESLGALILTGEGEKAFCVGLDLELLERAFADIGYFESVVRRLNGIVTRLEALPIPTIAAVNGFARAGGFEILLGCDLIVMANEARLGDVHTDAGVLPACATLRFARRVGAARAKEIIWSARWLSGPEAVQYGLACESVPRSQLQQCADKLARSFTSKPRAVIATIKGTFQQGAELGVKEGAELELQRFVSYMREQPYGVEGYRAYREGREPAWKVKV
jgi:enoyl-CoA hydratase/carnithine racemase